MTVASDVAQASNSSSAEMIVSRTTRHTVGGQ